MSDNTLIYIWHVMLQPKIVVNIFPTSHKILKLKKVFEYYESSPTISLYLPRHSMLFINAKGKNPLILFVFYSKRSKMNNPKILIKLRRLWDKYLLYTHLVQGGKDLNSLMFRWVHSTTLGTTQMCINLILYA